MDILCHAPGNRRKIEHRARFVRGTVVGVEGRGASQLAQFRRMIYLREQVIAEAWQTQTIQVIGNAGAEELKL